MQVVYVRSLRERGGLRLLGLRETRGGGDGGIPLAALQTSNVWANVVSALVLYLSPAAGLRRDGPEEDGAGSELYGGDVAPDAAEEWGELVDDLGGVYCGVYEPCSHGEAAEILVNVVNSTGMHWHLGPKIL